MVEKRYYTGVGSKKTPKEVCDLMTKIAGVLEKQGYVLRSGSAQGSDFAFQKGTKNKCVYIPWKNFGYGTPLEELNPEKVKEAREIVTKVHPAPHNLSEGSWKLHTRNVFQVLGNDLNDRSRFLLCYAEVDGDGVPRGGTRTAWMVAQMYGVPCINLFTNPDVAKQIIDGGRVDGITCINVYSKGVSKIGRFYSNFTHYPFKCEDGDFSSVEAYWYWLSTGGKSPRNTHGYKAKEEGRKYPQINEIDKEKIKAAIDIKMRDNIQTILLNDYFDLPLDHYYVYGGKQVDAGYEWLVEHIEKRRQQIFKHYKTKK